MPNTLVHIGLQGLATKAVCRGADAGFILLGCVIPDLPWVFRRVAVEVVPADHLLDLHLYAAVQSSLLLCVLLSAAFAALSAKPGRTFGLLAAGSLMHLLLDACEIKWSNGALLFAPFDWRLTHFDWVWPDGGLVQVLSLLGLVAFAVLWRGAAGGNAAGATSFARRPQAGSVRNSAAPGCGRLQQATFAVAGGADPGENTQRCSHPIRAGLTPAPFGTSPCQAAARLRCASPRHAGYSGRHSPWLGAPLAVALLGLYFALPALWLHGPERAGDYGAPVLRAPAERPGRAIAMDRVPLLRAGAAARVVAINGEAIEVENPGAGDGGTVSLTGVFTAPGRIRVERWHAYPRGLRDAESAAGLALVGLCWAVRGMRGVRAGNGNSRDGGTPALPGIAQGVGSHSENCPAGKGRA